MNAPPSAIFRANDIRGVYQETLTEDGVYQIGIALANAVFSCGGHCMALGRDGRLSSPALAKALAAGIAAGGIRVLDIGLAPTPALYFTAFEHADGNGAMLTGSHNPPAHNGIKMLVGGKTLGGKQAQQLLETRRQTPTADITPLDIRDEYTAAVCCATTPAARSLHLIIDAGNGVSGAFAPHLYAQLGHKITPLFCDIDGNFPNHHPDPAQPENLIAARTAMHKHNADAAFVFDGDGDRLGVLLNGEEDWIFADRLLMLLAQDMLSRHAGARVVFDVKCSALLPTWIEQCGGVADMQPTGHAFIKSRMRETGALLGGEMSGHFYFAENWRGFDDALLAGAKIATIFAAAAADDCPMRAIPCAVASPEIIIDIGARDGHALIAKMLEVATFTNAKLITIDGVRAEYNDGFGLARASNTTDSLVLRFEGKNQQSLERIQTEFRRALATVNVEWKTGR